MWPTAFIERLNASLSPEEIPLLLAALETPPAISVRLHPKKTPESLAFSSLLDGVVPWCPQGRYLSSRPSFTLDPLFHGGTYYVQEAASMSIWQLEPYMHPGIKVLDACAAPGGKSTLLLDLIPPDGLLVCNEPIGSRVPILAENISKWGYANALVTRNDPADFARLPGFFDMVLIDAPCSGEGMFRKDVRARQEWSPENVSLCAARQRRILSDVWPCLRPGGVLAYSTCTFNRAEDEEQVDWLCQTLGARVVLAPQHYYPHLTRGEGFFLAAVEKDGPKGERCAPRERAIPKGTPAPKDAPRPLQGAYTYAMNGSLLKAFPSAQYSSIQYLHTLLNGLHSGIAVATLKGKDWIPEADLALATDLRPDAFPTFEASLPQALSFLRREALTVPPSAPKGYLLVTYQSHPLGFVKNIGTRTNNLYPPARRIQMTASPSEGII